MENNSYFCMMFTLNEHIEYLILHHDCVIIPGWGALVAYYSDASYNSSTQIINKPVRKLGFNPSVSHNDGLLAHSIVRREGMTYDQAVRFIDQNVSSYKRQLTSGRELNMGRLGYFKSDASNHVDFVPFSFEMSKDQYYGLCNLPFARLEHIKRDNNAGKAIIVEGNWWARKSLKTAASIAVLLVLTILLSTPIMVNRNKHEMASLNVTEVKGPKQEIVTTDNDALRNDIAYVNDAKSNDSALQSSLMLDEGGNFYLIIASLTSYSQVNDFLASHAAVSSNAQVMKSGKYYYVYVAKSYEANRLYSFMTKLPKGYQAWVYKK